MENPNYDSFEQRPNRPTEIKKISLQIFFKLNLLWNAIIIIINCVYLLNYWNVLCNTNIRVWLWINVLFLTCRSFMYYSGMNNFNNMTGENNTLRSFTALLYIGNIHLLLFGYVMIYNDTNNCKIFSPQLEWIMERMILYKLIFIVFQLLLGVITFMSNEIPCTFNYIYSVIYLFGYQIKENQLNHKQPNNINCDICHMNCKISDNVMVLSCGHVFHDKCITSWRTLDNLCPTCQTVTV